MASPEQQIRKHLANFFVSVSHQPRWWYVIKINSENQHSLSNLLGLTYEEYITVFEVAGFIRVKDPSQQQVEFRSDRFKSFIHEFKLHLEIDFSNIVLDDQLVKRCYTVSVGTPQNEHVDIPIARNQFKLIESRLRLKPRINIGHEQALLRSHLDFVLYGSEPIQSSKHTLQEECAAESESAAPEVIKSATTDHEAGQMEIQNQGEVHFNQPVKECLLTLRTTELVNALLSEFFKTPETLESNQQSFYYLISNETFDPMDFADKVVETSKAIVQLRNKHRASQRYSAGIAAIAGSSRLQQEEVARKYPMLSYLNVDLSTIVDIHALLRDIMNLARDLDDSSLLDFPYLNGKPCTIIAVPKCSQREYFNTTAKSWIFRMLDAIVCSERIKNTDKEITDGDTATPPVYTEVNRSRKDAVRWVMSFLGKAFPDESLDTIIDLGLVSSSGKLTAEELQAMVDEGNISQRALRVIRKYLSATSLSNRQNVIPSERKLRALGRSDPLTPIYKKTRTPDGKTVHYWYKPLDRLLISYLFPVSSRNEWRFLKFTLGADHGAGAEQVGVLVEAFSGDKRLIYSEVFRIGEIECTKETSDILSESLARHVNDGLKKMLKDGVLCEGPGPDGVIQFTDSEASFVCNKQNSEVLASDVINAVPFKVHMTGDMAWYAVALGKENSSTNWCWICKLRKTEWQYGNFDCGPPQGPLWTLDELREAVTSRFKNEKSYLGVKRSPLIKKLGPDRYEVPTLHLQLGITNNLIDCMLRYAQERHGLEKLFGVPASHLREDATIEEEKLKECWQKYQKNLAICIKKKDDVVQWDKEYGQLLIETRLAKKALLEFLEFEGDNLLPAERRELEQDRTALHLDTAKLNSERKLLDTGRSGKQAENRTRWHCSAECVVKSTMIR
jgi:hypothetical protein